MTKRFLTPYKSYQFRGRDPVIGKVLTILQDKGDTFTEVSSNSGVSTTTIYNWRKGHTMRPQFATINAVARACGKELVFRNIQR